MILIVGTHNNKVHNTINIPTNTLSTLMKRPNTILNKLKYMSCKPNIIKELEPKNKRTLIIETTFDIFLNIHNRIKGNVRNCIYWQNVPKGVSNMAMFINTKTKKNAVHKVNFILSIFPLSKNVMYFFPITKPNT